jgi:cobalt/nickel transport protein
MKRVWPFVLAALGVCLLLGTLLSPFASSSPDGLERVAEEQGFLERAEGAELWEASPIPDYEMPGVRRSGAATALAGLAGTLIVFGLALGLGRLLAHARHTGTPRER